MVLPFEDLLNKPVELEEGVMKRLGECTGEDLERKVRYDLCQAKLNRYTADLISHLSKSFQPDWPDILARAIRRNPRVVRMLVMEDAPALQALLSKKDLTLVKKLPPLTADEGAGKHPLLKGVLKRKRADGVLVFGYPAGLSCAPLDQQLTFEEKKKMKRFSILVTLAVVLFGAPLFGTTFKVKEQITKENGKTKMVDAVLTVEADAVRIDDKIFNRETIKAVQYSYSKSPRWKTAIFVSPLFLLSPGRRHWLMVQAQEGFVVLKLEKGNYRQITASVETALGVTAERIEH